MVPLAPLLISSFAFNFNNFVLIYMLTLGGPRFTMSSGSLILVKVRQVLAPSIREASRMSDGMDCSLSSSTC
jgi:arabinogalactan oligomer/maltooligosaccharide transport system permease protein